MQRSNKIEQTVIMLDTGGFAGETFVSGFGGFAQEDSYTASTSCAEFTKWETNTPTPQLHFIDVQFSVWLIELWRIPLDLSHASL
jgi:hypothetical protein